MPYAAADGAKTNEPQRASVQLKTPAKIAHGATAIRHEPYHILLRIQQHSAGWIIIFGGLTRYLKNI